MTIFQGSLYHDITIMLALYGAVSGEPVSGEAALVINYLELRFGVILTTIRQIAKNVPSFFLQNLNQST